MEHLSRGRKVGSKNYPREFRALVVAQANDPARSMADVALEHGLNANMIARWRRAAESQATRVDRALRLPNPAPLFIRVTLPIQERLNGGLLVELGEIRIKLEAPVDEHMLRTVLAALRLET